jgi:membrane protein YqaA with SNARE-associated domain
MARATAALRAMTTLLDRRWLRAPIVFASALTGVPPLLATTVYTAQTPMPASTFAAVCLLGRSIRFVAIAAAPQLLR